jgi:hypothetical protein
MSSASSAKRHHIDTIDLGNAAEQQSGTTPKRPRTLLTVHSEVNLQQSITNDISVRNRLHDFSIEELRTLLRTLA